MAKVRPFFPAGFVALAMAGNWGARTGQVSSVEGDVTAADSAATERSADTRADTPSGLPQPGDLEYLGLGAMAFDRERGLLYIFEPFAVDDKPVVHVWRTGF